MHELASGGAPEPFSIRGHHLPTFNGLMMGETPASMGAGTRASAESLSGGITSETVDFSHLYTGNLSQFDATYRYDLIGETPEQADKSEAIVTATMQTFLDLPDEAPVHLTAAPDTLCGSCTFQQHCKMPAVAASDKMVLDVFEDVAEHLAGQDEQLTAPVTAENGIHTDARTVRAFLGYMAAEKAAHGTFYEDAVRARALFGHVLGPSAAAARERKAKNNT